MSDTHELGDLTPEEVAAIKKARAKRAASTRRVKVRGHHEASGGDYEFELEGDDAERVISRHAGLWSDDGEEVDDGDPAAGEPPAKRAPRKRASAPPADPPPTPAGRRGYWNRGDDG